MECLRQTLLARLQLAISYAASRLPYSSMLLMVTLLDRAMSFLPGGAYWRDEVAVTLWERSGVMMSNPARVPSV